MHFPARDFGTSIFYNIDGKKLVLISAIKVEFRRNPRHNAMAETLTVIQSYSAMYLYVCDISIATMLFSLAFSHLVYEVPR